MVGRGSFVLTLCPPSSQVPFPQNEANAMDVVVQFVIHSPGLSSPRISSSVPGPSAASLVPTSFLSCYCRRPQAISVFPPGE